MKFFTPYHIQLCELEVLSLDVLSILVLQVQYCVDLGCKVGKNFHPLSNSKKHMYFQYCKKIEKKINYVSGKFLNGGLVSRKCYHRHLSPGLLGTQLIDNPRVSLIQNLTCVYFSFFTSSVMHDTSNVRKRKMQMHVFVHIYIGTGIQSLQQVRVKKCPDCISSC